MTDVYRTKSPHAFAADPRADAESLTERARSQPLNSTSRGWRFTLTLRVLACAMALSVGGHVLADPESPPGGAPPPFQNDDEDEDEDDDDDEFAQAEGSPPEFSGGRGKRRRVDGPRIELLNYKDVSTLSRFVTEQGKLLPRRTTKVTAPFQRQLGSAVKRARFLALLPYVQNHEG